MTEFLNRILDPIFARMVERIRITRTEVLGALIDQNKQIQTNLDKSLPELERSLESRPDLIRLIREVMSYIEDESESLSQVVGELRQARKVSERAIKLGNDSQIDMSSVETYLKAIEVYLQTEPVTILHALQIFDLAPLQEALETLPDERFLQLDNVMDKVKRARGW